MFFDTLTGIGVFLDPPGLILLVMAALGWGLTIASGGGKPKFLQDTAPLAEMIRQGVRVQKVFFRAPAVRLFQRKIKNKNGFVREYCDKQLSTYRYSYGELISLYRDYERKKNGGTP